MKLVSLHGFRTFTNRTTAKSSCRRQTYVNVCVNRKILVLQPRCIQVHAPMYLCMKKKRFFIRKIKFFIKADLNGEKSLLAYASCNIYISRKKKMPMTEILSLFISHKKQTNKKTTKSNPHHNLLNISLEEENLYLTCMF